MTDECEYTPRAHPPPPRVAQVIAITNYIVALFPFMPLLAAAHLSFVPCTACSGLVSRSQTLRESGYARLAQARPTMQHILLVDYKGKI